VIGGPDSLVRASSGGVSVSQSAGRVTIKVPGGSIVVDANSEATLRVGRTGTGVSVTKGTAIIESSTGSRTITPGEQVSLDAQGRVKVTRGRGPEVADLVIAAGDSVVVHDPKPPTAIGISISSKCAGAGIVEIVARTPVSSYGERTVNVLVSPGSSKYRVRCSDGSEQQGAVVSEGTLSVLRDSGTRQLARTPPATQVDTDGRSYTVLYQSLMPKLTVRWPHAPASAGYRLRVSSPGGKTQLVTSGAPTHTFPPGALSEGMHQLMFEADSGAKSKATALSISFDNAAPTASLTSPAEGGFAAGAQVHVSGIALPGWTVSAGGIELAQDEQHRFSGTAAAPTGQRALVIRFAHPQRGVHQYLRRSAGGS